MHLRGDRDAPAAAEQTQAARSRSEDYQVPAEGAARPDSTGETALRELNLSWADGSWGRDEYTQTLAWAARAWETGKHPAARVEQVHHQVRLIVRQYTDLPLSALTGDSPFTDLHPAEQLARALTLHVLDGRIALPAAAPPDTTPGLHQVLNALTAREAFPRPLARLVGGAPDTPTTETGTGQQSGGPGTPSTVPPQEHRTATFGPGPATPVVQPGTTESDHAPGQQDTGPGDTSTAVDDDSDHEAGHPGEQHGVDTVGGLETLLLELGPGAHAYATGGPRWYVVVDKDRRVAWVGPGKRRGRPSVDTVLTRPALYRADGSLLTAQDVDQLRADVGVPGPADVARTVHVPDAADSGEAPVVPQLVGRQPDPEQAVPPHAPEPTEEQALRAPAPAPDVSGDDASRADDTGEPDTVRSDTVEAPDANARIVVEDGPSPSARSTVPDAGTDAAADPGRADLESGMAGADGVVAHSPDVPGPDDAPDRTADDRRAHEPSPEVPAWDEESGDVLDAGRVFAPPAYATGRGFGQALGAVSVELPNTALIDAVVTRVYEGARVMGVPVVEGWRPDPGFFAANLVEAHGGVLSLEVPTRSGEPYAVGVKVQLGDWSQLTDPRGGFVASEEVLSRLDESYRGVVSREFPRVQLVHESGHVQEVSATRSVTSGAARAALAALGDLAVAETPWAKFVSGAASWVVGAGTGKDAPGSAGTMAVVQYEKGASYRAISFLGNLRVGVSMLHADVNGVPFTSHELVPDAVVLQFPRENTRWAARPEGMRAATSAWWRASGSGEGEASDGSVADDFERAAVRRGNADLGPRDIRWHMWGGATDSAAGELGARVEIDLPVMSQLHAIQGLDDVRAAVFDVVSPVVREVGGPGWAVLGSFVSSQSLQSGFQEALQGGVWSAAIPAGVGSFDAFRIGLSLGESPEVVVREDRFTRVDGAETAVDVSSVGFSQVDQSGASLSLSEKSVAAGSQVANLLSGGLAGATSVTVRRAGEQMVVVDQAKMKHLDPLAEPTSLLRFPAEWRVTGLRTATTRIVHGHVLVRMLKREAERFLRESGPQDGGGVVLPADVRARRAPGRRLRLPDEYRSWIPPLIRVVRVDAGQGRALVQAVYTRVGELFPGYLPATDSGEGLSNADVFDNVRRVEQVFSPANLPAHLRQMWNGGVTVVLERSGALGRQQIMVRARVGRVDEFGGGRSWEFKAETYQGTNVSLATGRSESTSLNFALSPLNLSADFPVNWFHGKGWGLTPVSGSVNVSGWGLDTGSGPTAAGGKGAGLEKSAVFDSTVWVDVVVESVHTTASVHRPAESAPNDLLPVAVTVSAPEGLAEEWDPDTESFHSVLDFRTVEDTAAGAVSRVREPGFDVPATVRLPEDARLPPDATVMWNTRPLMEAAERALRKAGVPQLSPADYTQLARALHAFGANTDYYLTTGRRPQGYAVFTRRMGRSGFMGVGPEWWLTLNARVVDVDFTKVGVTSDSYQFLHTAVISNVAFSEKTDRVGGGVSGSVGFTVTPDKQPADYLKYAEKKQADLKGGTPHNVNVAVSPRWAMGGSTQRSTLKSHVAEKVDINIDDHAVTRVGARVVFTVETSSTFAGVVKAAVRGPLQAADEVRIDGLAVIPVAATDRLFDPPAPQTGPAVPHDGVLRVPPVSLSRGDGVGHGLLVQSPDLRDFVEDVIQEFAGDGRPADQELLRAVQIELRKLGRDYATRALFEDFLTGKDIKIPYRDGLGRLRTFVFTFRATVGSVRHSGRSAAQHVFESANVATRGTTTGTSRNTSVGGSLGVTVSEHPHDVFDLRRDAAVAVNLGGGRSRSGGVNTGLSHTNATNILHIGPSEEFVVELDLTAEVHSYWSLSNAGGSVVPAHGLLAMVGRDSGTRLLGRTTVDATVGYPVPLTREIPAVVRPARLTAVTNEPGPLAGIRPTRADLREAFVDALGGIQALRQAATELFSAFQDSPARHSWWAGPDETLINSVFSPSFLRPLLPQLLDGTEWKTEVAFPGVIHTTKANLTIRLGLSGLQPVRDTAGSPIRLGPDSEGLLDIGTLLKDFTNTGRSVRGSRGESLTATLDVTGRREFQPGLQKARPAGPPPSTGHQTGDEITSAQTPKKPALHLTPAGTAAGDVSRSVAVSPPGEAATDRAGDKTSRRTVALLEAPEATWLITLEPLPGTLNRSTAPSTIQVTVTDQAVRLYVPAERADHLTTLQPGRFDDPTAIVIHRTTAPDQSGLTPDQSGLTPDQSGLTPDQSGLTPDQSGLTPDQSGPAPDRSTTPDQPGPVTHTNEPAPTDGPDQGEADTDRTAPTTPGPVDTVRNDEEAGTEPTDPTDILGHQSAEPGQSTEPEQSTTPDRPTVPDRSAHTLDGGRFVEVAADGNCFHTAVGMVLGLSEAEVRARTVTYMRENEPDVESRIEGFGVSLKDLVAIISTDTAWAGPAGDLVPFMVAEALGVELDIHVTTSQNPSGLVHRVQPVTGRRTPAARGPVVLRLDQRRQHYSPWIADSTPRHTPDTDGPGVRADADGGPGPSTVTSEPDDASRTATTRGPSVPPAPDRAESPDPVTEHARTDTTSRAPERPATSSGTDSTARPGHRPDGRDADRSSPGRRGGVSFLRSLTRGWGGKPSADVETRPDVPATEPVGIAREHRTFEFSQHSRRLDYTQEQRVNSLVEQLKDLALQHRATGRPLPRLVVTGGGNGRRFPPRLREWTAGRTGRARAQNLAGMLRYRLGDLVGEGPDRFEILTRDSGLLPPSTEADVDVAQLRRRAVVSLQEPDIPAVTPGNGVPWYAERGGMGMAQVDEVAPATPDDAVTWSRGVAASVTYPDLAPRVGTVVEEMIGENHPHAWEEYLLKGVMFVEGDRLVWVLPVLGGVEPAPTTAADPVSRSTVKFASTGGGRAETRSSGTAVDASTIAVNALATAAGAAAAMAGVAVQLEAGSSRNTVDAQQSNVISGHKVFSTSSDAFVANEVRFHVFEDGVRTGPGLAVPLRLGVSFPTVHSGADAMRPDFDAHAEAPSASGTRKPVDGHEVLNAVNLAPLVAEVQRKLRADGMAPAVVMAVVRHLQTTLNPEALVNRSRSVLTSGDVSNPLEVGLLGHDFQGYFETRAEIRTSQFLGRTTATIQNRYDLGRGSATVRERGRQGEVSAAVGVTFAGVSAPVDAEVGDDLHPATGNLPNAGVGVGKGQSRASTMQRQVMPHTVLNPKDVMAAFGVVLSVTVAVQGKGIRHTVSHDVEAEITVPWQGGQGAAQFEERIHGVRRSPALFAPDMVQGPITGQPRVLALPSSGTRPAPASVVAPGSPGAARPSRLPVEGEPAALHSGRGLDFAVAVALPGSERVEQTFRTDLEERAGLTRQWFAAREIGLHFGTPALEASLSDLLAGYSRVIDIGSRQFRLSVRADLGDLLAEPSVYDMTVNMRESQGGTVGASIGNSRRFTVGGGVGIRIPTKVADFRIGGIKVAAEIEKKRRKSYEGTSKGYVRTETVTRVREFRMRLPIEMTVAEIKDDRVKTSTTWRLDDPDTHAQIALPESHWSSEPPLDTANLGRITDTRLRDDESVVDLAGRGASGVYPSFLVVPEIAQRLAGLYADLSGWPTVQRKRWLDDWTRWPEPIAELRRPDALAALLSRLGAKSGHTVLVPGPDGRNIAIRVRLTAVNPRDLRPTRGEVEIEQYAQGAVRHTQETETEWRYTASMSAGAHVKASLPGAGTRHDAEGDGASHGSGGSVKAAVMLTGQASYTRGRSHETVQGHIDISRATYGGNTFVVTTDVHIDATAEVVRSGRRLRSSSAFQVDSGLQLLIPESRVQELLPGMPGTPGTPGPGTGPSAARTPTDAGDDSGEQTAVADDGTTGAAPKRTYLAGNMLSGGVHVEHLEADSLVPTVLARLVDRGLIKVRSGKAVAARGLRKRGHDSAHWPLTDPLAVAVEEAFSPAALQAHFGSLIGTGVSRWFMTGRGLLRIRVTATQVGPPEGARQRPDVKLTLRAQGLGEVVDKKSSGLHLGVGGVVRVRAGDHAGHGGLEAQGRFGHGRKTVRGLAVKTLDIYRANPRSGSWQFDHAIVLNVELAEFYTPHPIAAVPAAAMRSLVMSAADLTGDLLAVERFWADRFSGNWSETLSDPSLQGRVRLLVPDHLTAPEEPDTPAFSFTRRFGTGPRWSDTPPEPQSLPEDFFHHVHPWDVPAASAVQRWARVAAAGPRSAPDLTTADEPWEQVPQAVRVGFGSPAGLEYDHYTGSSMLKSNLGDLLTHRYSVAVGDQRVTVGFVIGDARRVGGGSSYKGRHYRQEDSEPKAESERSTGWSFGIGPEGGAEPDGSRVLERMPVDWATGSGIKHTAAVGQTDEHNRQAVRNYTNVECDIQVVMRREGKNSPSLVVDVPGGLTFMLPVEQNGDFSYGLSDVLPLPRVSPEPARSLTTVSEDTEPEEPGAHGDRPGDEPGDTARTADDADGKGKGKGKDTGNGNDVAPGEDPSDESRRTALEEYLRRRLQLEAARAEQIVAVRANQTTSEVAGGSDGPPFPTFGQARAGVEAAEQALSAARTALLDLGIDPDSLDTPPSVGFDPAPGLPGGAPRPARSATAGVDARRLVDRAWGGAGPADPAADHARRTVETALERLSSAFRQAGETWIPADRTVDLLVALHRQGASLPGRLADGAYLVPVLEQHPEVLELAVRRPGFTAALLGLAAGSQVALLDLVVHLPRLRHDIDSGGPAFTDRLVARAPSLPEHLPGEVLTRLQQDDDRYRDFLGLPDRAPRQGTAADPVLARARRYADDAHGESVLTALARVETPVTPPLERISRQTARVLDGDEPDPGLATAIQQALVAQDLPARWTVLRSTGLTLTVEHRDRTHTFTMRVRLEDPRRAAVDGGEAPAAPERSNSVDTGFRDRTLARNWRHIGGSKPIPMSYALWITPKFSATHNEVSTSASFDTAVRTITSSRDPRLLEPFDFAVRWDIAIPDRDGDTSWTVLESGDDSRLRVWLPQQPEGPEGWPARLDRVVQDIPLAAVHTVRGADRLLARVREVLAEDLRDLSPQSQDTVREFFSEAALRSGLPVMLAGRHTSPTLHNAQGRPIGYLRVTARTAQPETSAWLPTGDGVELQSLVRVTEETTREVSVTNRVQGGLGLSFGLPAGLPFAPAVSGQAAWGAVHTLGTADVLQRQQGLRATGPTGFVQATVDYEVTLVRPAGIPGRSTTTSFQGPVVFHVPVADAVETGPPAPRLLPPEVAELRSLGVSTTVLRVEGAEGLYDHVERQLDTAGLLHAATGWTTLAGQADRALANRQILDNLRSQSHQRALLTEELGAGRRVTFTRTGIIGSEERVALDLTVERRVGEPVRHTASLPGVRLSNSLESGAPGGDRLASTSRDLSGAVGASGDPGIEVLGVGVPSVGGQWDFAAAVTTADKRGTVVVEQVHAPVPEGGGVEVFAVPAWLNAEFEGDPPIGEAVRIPITVHVAVPAYRTSAPSPEGEPATVGTVGGDTFRTVPSGSRPLDTTEVSALLQTAHVESVSGSRALLAAVDRLMGTAPGGPFRNLLEESGPADGAGVANDGGALTPEPAVVPEPGAQVPSRPWSDPTSGGWLARQARDVAFAGRTSLAPSMLRQSLAPTRLVANATRVFGDGLVTEFRSSAGLFADSVMRVTVMGRLRELRYAGTVGTADVRRGLGAVTTAAVTRTASGHHGPEAAAQGALAGLDVLVPTAQLALHPEQSDERATEGTTATLWMTSTGTATLHRVRATAHFTLTVETGRDGTAVTSLPADGRPVQESQVVESDGVEFLITDDDYHRFRHLLAGSGFPEPPLPPAPERRLPAAFVNGVATEPPVITSIRPVDGTRAVRDRVVALVDSVAPGVTSLRSGSYLPGVLPLIADMTSPAHLRTLAARPGAHAGLRFTHRSTFPVVVQVTMTARPRLEQAEAIMGRGVSVPAVAGTSRQDGSGGQGAEPGPSALTRAGGPRLNFGASLDSALAQFDLTLPDDAPSLRFPSSASVPGAVDTGRALPPVAEFEVPYTFTVTVSSTLLGRRPQAPVPPESGGHSDSFDAYAVLRLVADQDTIGPTGPVTGSGLTGKAPASTGRSTRDRDSRWRRPSLLGAAGRSAPTSGRVTGDAAATFSGTGQTPESQRLRGMLQRQAPQLPSISDGVLYEEPDPIGQDGAVPADDGLTEAGDTTPAPGDRFVSPPAPRSVRKDGTLVASGPADVLRRGPAAGRGGPTGDPLWAAARGAAVPRPVRHTWVDPVSQPAGEGPHAPRYAVRAGYDVRAFEWDGRSVTDLTVRVRLSGEGMSPAQVDAVWERALSGVGRVFNDPAEVLPDGSVLHVTLERVGGEDGDAHASVSVGGTGSATDQYRWRVDATEQDLAHEVGHQLGLRDEYRRVGAGDGPEVDGSLMGDYHAAAPDGLSQGGLRSRYLHLIGAHIGDRTDVHPPHTDPGAPRTIAPRAPGQLSAWPVPRDLPVFSWFAAENAEELLLGMRSDGVSFVDAPAAVPAVAQLAFRGADPFIVRLQGGRGMAMDRLMIRSADGQELHVFGRQLADLLGSLGWSPQRALVVHVQAEEEPGATLPLFLDVAERLDVPVHVVVADAPVRFGALDLEKWQVFRAEAGEPGLVERVGFMVTVQNVVLRHVPDSLLGTLPAAVVSAPNVLGDLVEADLPWPGVLTEHPVRFAAAVEAVAGRVERGEPPVQLVARSPFGEDEQAPPFGFDIRFDTSDTEASLDRVADALRDAGVDVAVTGDGARERRDDSRGDAWRLTWPQGGPARLASPFLTDRPRTWEQVGRVLTALGDQGVRPVGDGHVRVDAAPLGTDTESYRALVDLFAGHQDVLGRLAMDRLRPGDRPAVPHVQPLPPDAPPSLDDLLRVYGDDSPLDLRTAVGADGEPGHVVFGIWPSTLDPAETQIRIRITTRMVHAAATVSPDVHRQFESEDVGSHTDREDVVVRQASVGDERVVVRLPRVPDSMTFRRLVHTLFPGDDHRREAAALFVLNPWPSEVHWWVPEQRSPASLDWYAISPLLVRRDDSGLSFLSVDRPPNPLVSAAFAGEDPYVVHVSQELDGRTPPVVLGRQGESFFPTPVQFASLLADLGWSRSDRPFILVPETDERDELGDTVLPTWVTGLAEALRTPVHLVVPDFRLEVAEVGGLLGFGFYAEDPASEVQYGRREISVPRGLMRYAPDTDSHDTAPERLGDLVRIPADFTPALHDLRSALTRYRRERGVPAAGEGLVHYPVTRAERRLARLGLGGNWVDRFDRVVAASSGPGAHDTALTVERLWGPDVTGEGVTLYHQQPERYIQAVHAVAERVRRHESPVPLVAVSPDEERYTGLEVEFVIDGIEAAKRAVLDAVAQDLWEAGLSSSPEVGVYHSAAEAGYQGWWLELDNSVDGEVVSPKLRGPELRAQLPEVLAILRAHGARITPDTGGHKNISLSDFGTRIEPYMALLKLLGSAQDSLWRAGSQYRQGGHRGTSYAAPLRAPVRSEGYTEVAQVRLEFGHFAGANFEHADETAEARAELRFFDGSLNFEELLAQTYLAMALCKAAARLGDDVDVLDRLGFESLGSHSRVRQRVLYEGEYDGKRVAVYEPERVEDVRNFLLLLDVIFDRDELKDMAIALHSINTWPNHGNSTFDLLRRLDTMTDAVSSPMSRGEGEPAVHGPGEHVEADFFDETLESESESESEPGPGFAVSEYGPLDYFLSQRAAQNFLDMPEPDEEDPGRPVAPPFTDDDMDARIDLFHSGVGNAGRADSGSADGSQHFEDNFWEPDDHEGGTGSAGGAGHRGFLRTAEPHVTGRHRARVDDDRFFEVDEDGPGVRGGGSGGGARSGFTFVADDFLDDSDEDGPGVRGGGSGGGARSGFTFTADDLDDDLDEDGPGVRGGGSGGGARSDFTFVDDDFLDDSDDDSRRHRPPWGGHGGRAHDRRGERP